MLMPLGMTILTRAAGPDRVGRVMAVLGIPMLLGPIFGPILGGYMIDSLSWHWIFLINLPIGILAFVYAVMVLPKDDVEPSESFDFVGMLLLSPGLATFLYGVSSIPEAGTVADAEGADLGRHRHPADHRLRPVGAAPPQHPPAGRPAAAEEHELHRRDPGDDAVRDRVLRRQPAVPALLPGGPRRDGAQGRTAAGPAGHRRDADHAGRRLPLRQDRSRQDRDDRHRRDHGRHGDVHPDRCGHAVPLHHQRAVHHGPRHGRHDDADHERGAGHPEREHHRARLDVPEHHPAGRRLHRHGPVLGAADQRVQEQRRDQAGRRGR